MGKLSITAKITIWYTIFLVVIMTALVLLLTQTQYMQEKSAAERELVEILADVSEMVEDDGKDFVYDKGIKFYQEDTYISIYDANGELLVGRRPASFAEFPKLADKTSLTAEDTLGNKWYIYDSLFQPAEKPIWIRGMKRQSAYEHRTTVLWRFLMFFLPVLILLAVGGGWFITRRAFRPLRDIIRTTDEIRADADVSRRIPQSENRDELHELTQSINGMFDRIEKVLSQEKQFSSDVSHELRTPIAVIQSQSEFALEEPAYREEGLRAINQQAKQMNNLVSRLLMLSRSDAGTLPLNMENIDFSDLLEGIAEQQQVVAAEEDVEITTDIPPGIHVIADENMLIRIILNLISNAIRYGKTPNKESGPAGRIHIVLTEKNSQVCCTVSDNGPGIPSDEQSKIWDRFYQVDSSRTGSQAAESSAGLGLSMVRALTIAMGGTVTLQSAEGHGAAFTVKFPSVPEGRPGSEVKNV